MTDETWERTGDYTLLYTSQKPGSLFTFTREFNFRDHDVTSVATGGLKGPVSSYEEFRQFDQAILRTASEQMERLTAQFRREAAAQQRRENAAAVVAIFSHPLSHDVTAPQKASFAKKGPRVT